MKKNVWIMNHYAGNMPFSKGGRHYWFADFLQRNGYSPVVFCCNNKHNPGTEKYYDTDALWEEHIAEEIKTPFIYVKSCKYSGNKLERVFNIIGFYKNVKKAAKEYAMKHEGPDIIYASSVHPLTLVAGIQLAKYFNVKCICEARDLWPEAIIAYSSKLTKTHFISKILYQGEKWIYKKADALIFTQEGGADYIREHKWDAENGGPINMDKVYHINNGVDLAAFKENLNRFRYEDEDLDNPNIYKVVYAGAIRRINNLGIILDAAKKIKNPLVKFIIFGNGDELEKLKQRVIDENINNVVFKGRVNKQYIPSIVSRADLNVVHWEMNPLLRVGESYNKSFEYFAAGKPVFYTIRPGYSIVEKYNCGRLTEGFTADDIARGIEKMSQLSEDEKKQLEKNSYAAAEAYDFSVLTKKLINIIEHQ